MFRFLSLIALAPSALASTDWAPTAAETELIHQLSARDGSPSCASLEALVPDPVASFEHLIDHVQMPPWIGMRAAECLMIGHPVEAKPLMLGWVVNPEMKGLSIEALSLLDQLPVEVAVEVARKAISAGPNPEDARARVARAKNPQIAACAAPVAP
jgi:hypothetical protein